MKLEISNEQMPDCLEGRYYFILGMIEGALEVNAIWNDNPLIDGVIQVLEAADRNEEEESILQRLKYLKSLPIPTPF